MKFQTKTYSVETHNLPVDEVYIVTHQPDKFQDSALAVIINKILAKKYFEYKLRIVDSASAATQYAALSSAARSKKSTLFATLKNLLKRPFTAGKPSTELVARVLMKDQDAVLLLRSKVDSETPIEIQLSEFADKLAQYNRVYFDNITGVSVEPKCAEECYDFIPTYREQYKEADMPMLGSTPEMPARKNQSRFTHKKAAAPVSFGGQAKAQTDLSPRELAIKIRDEIAELQRKNGVNILFEELGRDFFESLNQLPHLELSDLLIDENYKIILPQYNMEIQMPVLSKVVYLLFLLHPEGIRLKEMADYKEELHRLYMTVSPRTDIEQMQQSVNDLCDPENGSIHQKISRIGAAFRENLLTDIAQHYCITGKRGENKHILLSKSKISIPKSLRKS